MDTTLSDDIVMLRPLQMLDCDALYEAVRESVTEVGLWLPWCHADYARGDSAAFINTTIHWWDTRTQFIFGVFDVADGVLSGTVGVNHLNQQHRFANVGYWMRTSRTRRGFASRAVRLAARFAFSTLGLVRVEIAAQPENTASRRVAERSGATFEGIFRNRIYARGRAYPAALYSLIPEDMAAS